MNISIFGLGYVGTVAMGCLATLGHRVIGVDVSKDKVDLINEGKSPIIENEIGSIVAEYRSKGMICATLDLSQAILQTDVSFLCLGTPSSPNGHLNLESVFRVVGEIGETLRHKTTFHVIAIRSTVLPDTHAKVVQMIQNASGKQPDSHFGIVSNPEFLREGTAVKDFYNPPYTLLASQSERAIAIMKQVYSGINAPVILTSLPVAELIKYVSNSYHALKIVFANEIGNICRRLGADSHELMRIFSLDTKLNISSAYLSPGFAYGGSCLPKDLKALCTLAHDLYLNCPVIESVQRSNELQKDLVLNQILEFGKRSIGFLGISFKEGTDDLRDSPIVDVMEKLLGKGYDIRIYDKNVHLSKLVGANQEYIIKRIPLISRFITNNLAEVLEKSEVIVLVNKDNDSPGILGQLSAEKIVYDLVHIGADRSLGKAMYKGIAW
jgi:GDP-mannose 6-dehydrogenase